MKLSRDILEELDIELQDVREPINVMSIGEALSLLKECAERLVKKSEQYRLTEDADIKVDCIDIVTARLNDFAQVFRDILIFLRKEEGTYRGREGKTNSLRYSIASYDTFGFPQTEDEKAFLKELLLRNEITHDYFNRELHQFKLISMMENCMEGAVDVHRHLFQFCQDNNLLEKYLNRNEK